MLLHVLRTGFPDGPPTRVGTSLSDLVERLGQAKAMADAVIYADSLIAPLR
jgi:hypothetical protein